MKWGIETSYPSICQINNRNALCKSSNALNFWVILSSFVSNHCWLDVQKDEFLFVCFCLGFWNTVFLPSKTNIGDLIYTYSFFFILSIKKMAVFLKIIFFCCMWNICRQECILLVRATWCFCWRKGHRNLLI